MESLQPADMGCLHFNWSFQKMGMKPGKATLRSRQDGRTEDAELVQPQLEVKWNKILSR